MKATATPVTAVTQNIVFIPLEKTIDNLDQAGVIDNDKVLEIAESLQRNRDNGTKGLLQVPVARSTADGNYELAFGRHRRAAFFYLMAQGDKFFESMPLIVREMDDLAMFEALATENFKRRDINALEAAEILHAYMTKYHKTSVEAAAFFGKTEEYIRSTVRFLNLAAPAKEMLRSGEMNISTARLILSVQKIIPADDLEGVLEDIKSNIYDSPHDCIENAATVNAQQLSNQNAPRLNSTKFPVKFLAPVQGKDIAELLDVEKADKARKELLNEIMKLIASGMEITDDQFPAFTHDQLEDVRILVNPPECAACARFVQLDGSKYCGFKRCFERKTQAWKRAEMAKVSKETGIPLYANEAQDGKAVPLAHYSETDEKLFEARHADLRLMPTRGNETMYRNFKGLPGNLKLVAVGKTAEKRLKGDAEKSAGKQAGSTDLKRAEEQAHMQMLVRELKDDFLNRFTYHVIAPAFEALFEGLTNLPFAVYLFDEIFDNMGEPDIPQGVDDLRDQMAQIRAMIGTKLKAGGLKQLHHVCAFQVMDWRIKDFSSRFYKAKKPLIEIAKAAQKIAEEWSVKLPKNFMDQAETYQADFEKEVKALGKA